MTAVEIVRYEPTSPRGDALFNALQAGARDAKVIVTKSPKYRGTAPWLMFWGPGAPERAADMRTHLARGGRAIALDLAYWDRDRKVRISIDAPHPQAVVMQKDRSPHRLKNDRITVLNAWKSTGPVMVAGLGDKARVQYGADTVDAWERSMIEQCRERWPGRQIHYRPKRAGAPVPADVIRASAQPIELALNRASLLITWHSNVAVDAIRMGIPVICRDGAASAVCPSTFGETDPTPLAPHVRDRFLANLAWFQWAPSEARQCWSFLTEVLS